MVPAGSKKRAPWYNEKQKANHDRDLILVFFLACLCRNEPKIHQTECQMTAKWCPRGPWPESVIRTFFDPAVQSELFVTRKCSQNFPWPESVIRTFCYPIYMLMHVKHVILNPLNLVAVGRGAALLYKHVYYICIATPRYEIVLVQDYMCHMHKNIYKSHIH